MTTKTDAVRECAEEALIKYMVDRFLGWQLPEDFNPDNGISFKPTFNDHLPVPMKCNPTGTNLFDARQAEAMVRYMLEGKHFPPSVPSLTIPAPKSVDIINDLLYHALRKLIEDLKRAPMEKHTNREIAERLEYLIAEAK